MKTNTITPEQAMPSIRLVDAKTNIERWLSISDYSVDADDYLSIFRLHFSNNTSKEYHLVRSDVSLVDVAVTLFSSVTSLRSAKNLLEDMNKIAGKTKWHKRSGAVGLAIQSSVLLYEFLKYQNVSKEGYYDAAGNLFLARKIKTTNKNDYRSDDDGD